MNIWQGMCCMVACVLGMSTAAYAKDIKILFTGQTHAMVYTCSCPVETDGGVARRAALVKELRHANPGLLLVDGGGFFAGGLLDEYTTNVDLDRQRTEINLKAMALMRYDAVGVSADEFNFGSEFLQKSMKTSGIPFLSCNADEGIFLPAVIKDVNGVSVAIIGVTGRDAVEKAGGLQFSDPEKAVRDTVAACRKKGARLVVLLSALNDEDLALVLARVPGIDVALTRNPAKDKEIVQKKGNVIVASPSWQGRKMVVVTLKLGNDGIPLDYTADDIRLSDTIKDDPAITAFLPQCFADSNCKKKGFAGICQNPGNMSARCQFSALAKVELIVVQPRSSQVTGTEGVIEALKQDFPGLVVTQLVYPDPKAQKLVSALGMNTLPLFVFGKEIEADNRFLRIKDKVIQKAGYYVIRPEFGGVSNFLDRKPTSGSLDLFVSLFDPTTADTLAAAHDFNPVVHFLAREEKGEMDAKGGAAEVEEYLRAVCVKKYAPEKFVSYLTCRARTIKSTWWDDCAAGVDVRLIKSCARGPEGLELLRNNIAINKELKVMFGPTYLVDNTEIFSTQGIPTKEELKKVLHSQKK
ncbi:MAG TPA: hypothetical protein PLO85_01345 [Candidatus Omnitrophota bacterium]|nr:hypothetical protein [Candidatus Omnitrophota bacterium]